jgi:hypothetical protein
MRKTYETLTTAVRGRITQVQCIRIDHIGYDVGPWRELGPIEGREGLNAEDLPVFQDLASFGCWVLGL